jgi:hypothetical protein
MRSLWYVITNNPVNLDDCLHLAGRTTISEVSMELRVYESLREMFFVTHYVVRLTWMFETGEVTREKILVGDIDYRGDVNKASIDKANLCLRAILERIEQTGVRLRGAKKIFTQPLSCDIIHTPSWL